MGEDVGFKRLSVAKFWTFVEKAGLLTESLEVRCPICQIRTLVCDTDPDDCVTVNCLEHTEAQVYGRLREMAAEMAREKPKPTRPKFPQAMSAKEIRMTDFRPPRWAVEELVGEGLTLLCGDPKRGKSWMALGLAISVASGARALCRLRTTKGEVAYIALEDSFPRLKERLAKVLGESPAPEDLHFFCEWPSMSQGGLQLLEQWLEEHPEAILVVIDTLQRFRGVPRGDGSYANDYSELSALKRLADKFRVSFLVVHHTRKGVSEDPFHRVSGTQGITGSADTSLVLDRQHGKDTAQLYVTGRDVLEVTHDLVWDWTRCTWSIGELQRDE